MGNTHTLRMRLGYWRTRRALNIRQLAQASHVSSTTIVKIENDPSYIPRSNVTRKLAEALGIKIEELLVDESERAA